MSYCIALDYFMYVYRLQFLGRRFLIIERNKQFKVVILQMTTDAYEFNELVLEPASFAACPLLSVERGIWLFLLMLLFYLYNLHNLLYFDGLIVWQVKAIQV